MTVREHPDSGGYRLKGTPNQGLAGATLGFFFGFAAVSLFGPTAEEFEDVLSLSPAAVGFLVAMPSLSGSLLRIPFAAWADGNGGRTPFLTLLGLSLVGMLGLTLVIYLLHPQALDRSLYPLLLFLGLLSGCGIATFSVGITQVSYWFPQDRQGWALGAYAGFGNIAPGLFSLLIPVALGSVGLAGSYLAWLLFLVVGFAIYYKMGCNARSFQLTEQGAPFERAKAISRTYGQEIFPSGGVADTLKTSARVWKTWALVLMYFTTFGGFLALTAWFPTYWRSFFDLGGVSAGALTALYSVGASVIRVPGGLIADRVGGEVTAMASLSILTAGALVLAVSGLLWLSVAGLVLLALGMGVNNAAVFKLVPREVPEAVGGAAGWVGGLGAFGGFVIPPIMGAFVAAQGDQGYASGFVVFIALAVIALPATLALRRSASHRTRGSTANLAERADSG